jgi:hypothetical protein
LQQKVSHSVICNSSNAISSSNHRHSTGLTPPLYQSTIEQNNSQIHQQYQHHQTMSNNSPKVTPSTAPTAPPESTDLAKSSHAATEGEATLLVSEFPPPPFYYRQAASLTPPLIPHEALARGTQRAAAVAEKARAEAERLRGLASAEGGETINLGGEAPVETSDDGDVVAVFGEIVEDPLLFEPLDNCEDPRVVRDELKRLNRLVLQKFVTLVQDLVYRPSENK